MNYGCSGIEKKRILEPEDPLCSSSSGIIPKIAAHTFSAEYILKLGKLRENHFILPL